MPLTETTVSTDTATDLLLARLACADATPKKVRDDVNKLCERSAGEWDALRDQLIDSGDLARGKRNTITLTDSGRARALRFLGIDDMPPKTKWAAVVSNLLLPKALNLPPAEAARLTDHGERVVTRPVLPAVRQRDGAVEGGEGGGEALPLAVVEALVVVEVEDGGHEIVLAGALLEAAHQVGDRDVEVLRVDDRDVEQETADGASHRLGAALMTHGPRQPPRLRPPPIAIHDDRDVQRRRRAGR